VSAQPEVPVPAPHGTYAAAMAHQTRQEERCALCKRAAALYMKGYRDRGKAAPGLGWPLQLTPARPRRWFPVAGGPHG
jgi:hypothetical protein